MWAPTECFQPLYLPYSQIELYSFHSEVSRTPFADPVGVTSAHDPPSALELKRSLTLLKACLNDLCTLSEQKGREEQEPLGTRVTDPLLPNTQDTVTNNQPNRVYTTSTVANVLNAFFEPFKGAFGFCLEINCTARKQSAGTKLCRVHLQIVILLSYGCNVFE